MAQGAFTQLSTYNATTFETTSDLLIKAQVIEDEKYPDYGEAMKTIRLTELLEKGEQTITLDVVVREDWGRYRGIIGRDG